MKKILLRLFKKKDALGIPESLVFVSTIVVVVLSLVFAVNFNKRANFVLPKQQENNTLKNVESVFYPASDRYVEIPHLFEKLENDKITIVVTLPDTIYTDTYLAVTSYYRALYCYYDRELIYYQGTSDEVSFGKILNLIPLKSEYARKDIRLQLGRSIIKSPALIDYMKIGTISQINLSLLHRDLWGIGFIIVAIVLALVFIVFGFTRLFIGKKPSLEYKRLTNCILSLGLFLVFCALWGYSELLISQLIMNQTIIWYVVSFISFFMMPVTLLYSVSNILNSGRVLTDSLIILIILSLFSSIILFVFFDVQLIKSLFVAHILLFVTVISLLILIVRETSLTKVSYMTFLCFSIIIYLIGLTVSYATFAITYDQYYYNYYFFFTLCFIFLYSVAYILKVMTTKIDEVTTKINWQANLKMIEAFSDVVEFRSQISGKHVQHVRCISKLLGDCVMKEYPEYKLTPRKVELIAFASLLHDIGKIYIPEEILMKKTPLTDEEYNLIKQHPEKGAAIVKRMKFLKDIGCYDYGMDICLYHHERFNGSGYPFGLKGDVIPISAQIVTAADIIDALTNKRLYERTYSMETALDMVIDGDCGNFSKKIIHCLEIVKDEIIRDKDILAYE